MSRPSSKGIHKDRFNEEGLSIWGLIPLATKVSTQDTGGELYVFQHTNMGKSGPPRHVHHAQDEWFYVVNGEFAAEIGNEKFWLRPGDSLFAPRGGPHAWAHVCEQPGTLIAAVSPAGTFEKFIREATMHAAVPSPEDVAKAFEAHGMTVGPPPEVD